MNAPHASTATIERLIAGKIIEHMLAKYEYLRVETGEKTVLLTKGFEVEDVLAAVHSTDDGEVWLFTPEPEYKFVKLVIGNGVSMISDYQDELEEVLGAAIDLSEALGA